jgi:phenylalanyl-tRNA synthetase beta chain
MGLEAKEVIENGSKIIVEVPPHRSDILHPCDIAEDIGIAFGYNNIPKVFPPTNTIGKQIPENKFTDLLRHELAQAGYIECLTMSLLSIKEAYNFLRKEPNLSEAVQIANPKTVEFEIVRTSLITGLLKTLQSNAGESVPQRIFEISDVVLLDDT